MQRVNEYRFYDLGTKLQTLKAIRDTTPLKTCMWDVWTARDALNNLLQDPVSLQVCRSAAEEIISTTTKFVPDELSKWSDVKDDKRVGLWATILGSEIDSFSTVLKAECETLDTYMVSQKGAYSTAVLIERAEIALPEDTRKKLDKIVITDIREAGRCLAFDLPTAVGFHILRAVESVMRTLYLQVKQQLSEHKKPQNWGGYIEKLREAQVDQKIIDVLGGIKNQYRNPLAHPDAVLDVNEATVLLPQGIAAIQLMAQELT